LNQEGLGTRPTAAQHVNIADMQSAATVAIEHRACATRTFDKEIT
jgi:hypothetical protein